MYFSLRGDKNPLQIEAISSILITVSTGNVLNLVNVLILLGRDCKNYSHSPINLCNFMCETTILENDTKIIPKLVRFLF